MTATITNSQDRSSDTETQFINAVPVRRYGQLIAGFCIVVLTVGFVLSLARNDNLDWATVSENLTAETVLRGLVVTFQLSIVSMLAGVVLGALLAVARMSENRLLQVVSITYVWFFRGVPLLVLILIWGNFGLLFSHLSLGIPFTNVVFFEVETNTVLTTFVAACIALALHEAAYMAEIVRGGILAVDAGQQEAAAALGMTKGRAMRRIILPQAMRVIIPPTGNQFITLIKSSSLVSVIAGGDLMTAVTDIGASNYRIIETLLVGTFWYLVIVSVLSIGQRFLERRLSRGFTR